MRHKVGKNLQLDLMQFELGIVLLSDKDLDVEQTNKKGQQIPVNNYLSVFLPFFPLSFFPIQIEPSPLFQGHLDLNRLCLFKCQRLPVPPFYE